MSPKPADTPRLFLPALKLAYIDSTAHVDQSGNVDGVLHRFRDPIAPERTEYWYLEFAHQAGGWSVLMNSVLHVLHLWQPCLEPNEAAIPIERRLLSLTNPVGGPQ